MSLTSEDLARFQRRALDFDASYESQDADKLFISGSALAGDVNELVMEVRRLRSLLGFACVHCSDTRKMTHRGQVVMCTRCPTPCQSCRSGGVGPYCDSIPCGCECHSGTKS